jgi:hypothetical protein
LLVSQKYRVKPERISRSPKLVLSSHGFKIILEIYTNIANIILMINIFRITKGCLVSEGKYEGKGDVG